MLALVLMAAATAFAADAQQPNAARPADLNAAVVKVNGTAISERSVRQEMEIFYPMNRVHGGMRPDKFAEVRNQATTELVVDELIYQQAVKEGTLVPMGRVETEYRRIRAKYGAQKFDTDLKKDGSTKEKYLHELQKRMSMERAFNRKVVAPSRMSDAQLRAYYQQHAKQFRRPPSVRAYLFLAAAGKDAIAADDRAARQKADMVYQQLKAGKSFEDLARQYSDDKYRVMGGDLGWVHQGRLDPEFEKVAFSLQAGEFSPVFRTAYGYNIMKAAARDNGKQMTFLEMKGQLKARLEKERLEQRRGDLIEALKKSARIEVLDPSVKLALSRPSKPAEPVAAH